MHLKAFSHHVPFILQWINAKITLSYIFLPTFFSQHLSTLHTTFLISITITLESLLLEAVHNGTALVAKRARRFVGVFHPFMRYLVLKKGGIYRFLLSRDINYWILFKGFQGRIDIPLYKFNSKALREILYQIQSMLLEAVHNGTALVAKRARRFQGMLMRCLVLRRIGK